MEALNAHLLQKTVGCLDGVAVAPDEGVVSRSVGEHRGPARHRKLKRRTNKLITPEYKQQQLDDALIFAADCDPEVAAELIAEGANVHGMALIMAIQADCYEVAQQLVNAGSDVNIICKNTTPLIHAITGGYDYMVSLLVNAGADLNLPDPKTGQSPLETARQCEYRTAQREANRPKIIHILKEAGAK